MCTLLHANPEPFFERYPLMKRVIIVLVSLALTSPVAQAKGRPSLPAPDPERGSIAVTVWKPGFNIGRHPRTSVDEVFFVKLDEGSKFFGDSGLIMSSHTDSGQTYLLNASPGRYVAVAARRRNHTLTLKFEDMGGNDYRYLFPMALIAESEVTVVEGKMTFMGRYWLAVARLAPRAKHLDAAQAHYSRRLPLRSSHGGYFSRTTYSVRMKRVAKDSETERRFWTIARDKAFKGDPRWQVQVQRQLDAMEKREPN